MSTPIVIVKNKVRKSLKRKHPWLFSGAIKTVDGQPNHGDIVKVILGDGQPIGVGYWNGHSNIRVRMLDWDADTWVNDDFWRQRIEEAIVRRQPLKSATRLINAENDYLPGLVVDKYDNWLVMQCLSKGIDDRKELIASILADVLKPQGIYERSDVDIRHLEGLPETTGLLWGDEPPELIEIEENGHRLLVDIRTGHKTGFYLDQQDNRRQMQVWVEAHPNRENLVILNTFCFTGGFAVAALAGGAKRVISVDSSQEALDIAKQNVALNGFEVNDDDFVQANVFDVLREYRDQNQQFDMVILDPPKFARHAKQVKKASRGYKDINWLAFRILNEGGHLWTFSCSNAIDADLFQKIVFGAMIDAEVEGQIIGRMGAASDHPVALTFPEGAYLKGLKCRT